MTAADTDLAEEHEAGADAESRPRPRLWRTEAIWIEGVFVTAVALFLTTFSSAVASATVPSR